MAFTANMGKFKIILRHSTVMKKHKD